jgi:hypothetical protein
MFPSLATCKHVHIPATYCCIHRSLRKPSPSDDILHMPSLCTMHSYLLEVLERDVFSRCVGHVFARYQKHQWRQLISTVIGLGTLNVKLIMWDVLLSRPPLWSSGQSSCLQIQRSRVRFPVLQIFWDVLGLERGPLSLVRTTEKLHEWRSSSSGSRKPRSMAVGIRCALYPQ